MRPPAFQFYAKDFLVGVMGMTDQEIGVYVKMLAIQWERGALPSKPSEIRAEIGSKSLPSARVLAKFEAGPDGLLRNSRLELERQKQESFRRSRSDNAQSRWKHQHSTSNARALDVDKVSICIPHALQSASASAKREGFAPPTEAEAIAEAVSIGLPAKEGSSFINYHQARGWVVGKVRMKDWRAAMRTWLSNFRKFNPSTSAASAIGGLRTGRAC